jgi:hypothetical protein
MLLELDKSWGQPPGYWLSQPSELRVSLLAEHLLATGRVRPLVKRPPTPKAPPPAAPAAPKVPRRVFR